MKILGGYGKKALEHNIRQYMEDGSTKEDARRMAIRIAQRFFFRAKPGVKLPGYLKLEE